MALQTNTFFGDDLKELVDEGGAYLRLSEADTRRLKNKFNFTDEQIQLFLEAFSVFDRDRDGVISSGELGAVMMGLGHRPSLQEIEALIKGVDTDNSGTIYFEEFLQIMSRKMISDPEQELREVFSVFDLNSDGYISPAELHDMLARFGEKISMEEVQEMIKEADVNCDGVVDFAEFKGILTAK